VAQVWANSAHPDRELVIPIIETASDYDRRMQAAFHELADVESRGADQIHESMRLVFSDVTDLRAASDGIDDTIPLESGYELFMSARRVVVAAAAATIRRQSHYHGSIPARARNHANHVRLGHTRKGSYIVPIISTARPPKPPAADEDFHLDMEVEETLFDRRVTQTLARSLDTLHEIVVQREPSPSNADVLDAVGEGVSYELSKAVWDVLRTDAVDDLGISFNWALGATRPSDAVESVGFPREAADRLEAVTGKLKTVPKTREDVIYGVIEDLHESLDQLDSRIGVKAVIDGRLRHVWLDLTHDDYEIALRCHAEKRRIIARGVITTAPRRDATMTVTNFGPEETLFPVSPERMRQ
jgi:hypothetical protein